MASTELLQPAAGHQPAEVEDDRPVRVDRRRRRAGRAARAARPGRRPRGSSARGARSAGGSDVAEVPDDRRADGHRRRRARHKPPLDERVVELAEGEVQPAVARGGDGRARGRARRIRTATPRLARCERDRHQGVRVVRVKDRRAQLAQAAREAPLVKRRSAAPGSAARGARRGWTSLPSRVSCAGRPRAASATI